TVQDRRHNAPAHPQERTSRTEPTPRRKETSGSAPATMASNVPRFEQMMNHQPHDAATEQRIAELTATVKDRSERRKRLTRWGVVAILAGIFTPATPGVVALLWEPGPWVGPAFVAGGVLGIALFFTAVVVMFRGILARIAAERANQEIISIDPSRSLLNSKSSRAMRGMLDS